MSPDIDQHCIFPSIEEYGEDFDGRMRSAINWECRRIEDWEETGINDTYRVIFQNSRLKLMLAFSMSVQLKLMMREWQSPTGGVGVVKVVHYLMTQITGCLHGKLTRLSPSQHTPSSKLTRTSTS